MSSSTQVDRARIFRDLHTSPKILALPCVWEVAGSLLFEAAGFRAVGTTSRGIAASLGYADGEQMSRDQMLQVVEGIAAHLSIPLSADMERGYGESAEEVAETVRGVIAAGAVGINIEDGINTEGGDGPAQLTDISLHAEKVSAASEAARSAGVPIVVNARTDVYWLEVDQPEGRLAHAVKRANAYREAGADCLFVPGVKDPQAIGGLVKEIDGPLNVLGGKGVPPIRELERLGVARVSMGSGPMRASLGVVKRIAQELLGPGTYDSFLEDSVPYEELIKLLVREGPVHIDHPRESGS
jgi:2-methylisocitrate lyase-like PEP mutase family enzyme